VAEDRKIRLRNRSTQSEVENTTVTGNKRRAGSALSITGSTRSISALGSRKSDFERWKAEGARPRSRRQFSTQN
jgi:hypothetical protein